MGERSITILLGVGKSKRRVAVPVVSFDEDRVGIANHEPNEDGAETLAPWPFAAGGISQPDIDKCGSLRPVEDELADSLDNWPNPD